MNPKSVVSLLCESCPICKKPISILIDPKTLQIQRTGLATVIDTHGLSDKDPHIRILHVDSKGDVRAFETVTAITLTEEMVSPDLKVEILKEKITILERRVLDQNKVIDELKKANEELYN
ncbi:MAG: hypothetical protein ACFFDT_07015 [Candidatus Hodarchaeota archaeon]